MQTMICLISLQKDFKRRKEIRLRFLNFYEKFKIIDAVYGADLSTKEYFSYALKYVLKYKKLISPSELGCALSHVKAYEEFLKSGFEFLLILEDDILGSDECINQAIKMSKLMRENSILICGAQDCNNLRYNIYGKKVNSNLYLIAPFCYKFVFGTCSYILDKKAAKHILNSQKNIIKVADSWQELLNNEVIMYYSDIFHHPSQRDEKNSSIEQERIDMRKNTVYKKDINAYLHTLKYIFLSKFYKYFKGYEKIFKSGKK